MTQTKVKNYIVKSDGTLKEIPKDLETRNGKYLPPRASEIISLDGQRMALYPQDSMRPWKLCEVVIQPDAFRASDGKTVYGQFLPNLFRRALDTTSKKWRTAEIVLLACVGLSILTSAGAFIAVWRMGRILELW